MSVKRLYFNHLHKFRPLSFQRSPAGTGEASTDATHEAHTKQTGTGEATQEGTPAAVGIGEASNNATQKRHTKQTRRPDGATQKERPPTIGTVTPYYII